jgi:hypothetical protein
MYLVKQSSFNSQRGERASGLRVDTTWAPITESHKDKGNEKIF